MKRIRTRKLELKDRRSLFNEEMSKEMQKLEDLSWEQLRDVIMNMLQVPVWLRMERVQMIGSKTKKQEIGVMM